MLYLCYVSVAVTVEYTEGSYQVLCDVVCIVCTGILAESLDTAHPLQELCFVYQAIACHRKWSYRVIALNSFLRETEDCGQVVSIPASYLGGLETDYPGKFFVVILSPYRQVAGIYQSISFPIITPSSGVLTEKPVVT
jgi:hypothetical protein